MSRSKRTISRRTVLRGVGAAMAMPLLDIMLPSTANASTMHEAPRRAAFFYIPNGVEQTDWHPKDTGENFELSPTLQALAPVRNKISLLTQLDRTKVPGTDGHAQCGSCWLSSARPDELSPAGYPLKRTLDQTIARATGKHTPFRSLELSCNPHKDNKESIYFDAISWYGQGHVARSMTDPRKIFDRLFAVQQQADHRSILDVVMADAKDLRRRLGRIDATKLDEYMDSVRTVEIQIQRVEVKQKELIKANLKVPLAGATKRDEYIQMIGDLMILAFQTDMTRVATIMVAPERWATAYQIDEVWKTAQTHHTLTHAQDSPKVRERLQSLDRFHIQQYADIAAKMDTITEGDRTLLDNSMFVLGSGLSSGKDHTQTNLPTVIAGSAGGAIKTGHHTSYPQGTPISNLWLSMARVMGVKVDHHGDSTGPLKDFLA